MTEERDLYGLLGVPRTATQEEIKKAYRRLAREHHPDVAGSAGSEEHFKKVTGAYEILSDPAKRRQYDMFGQPGQMGQFPFGDITDIFDFFFGGQSPFGGTAARRAGPRASRTQRGEGVLASLTLSFEEAAFGVTKDVEVEALVECERCDGSGCEPGSGLSRCRYCGGTGEVQDMRRSIFGTVMTARTCMTCRGTGEEIESRCEQCGGDGRTAKAQTVTVEIPPGVSDGLELRVADAGHAGRAGGPRGDLYVSLRVRPHPVFDRRGQDLFAVLEVPMTQAALGAEVEIGTLDGSERIRIEPGTRSGTALRLRNLGLPNLGRRGRGDLFLTIDVATPESAGKEERALLERLAELREETTRKGEPASGRLRRPEG